MKRRHIIALCAVALALGAGCAATTTTLPTETTPAATQLGLGGEIGGLLGRPGYAGSVGINYEASGCCSVGTYITYSKLTEAGGLAIDLETIEKDDPKQPGVTDILEGGAELAAVVPSIANWAWMEDRLRLRIRAGMAGTPPDNESFGRRGFAGGASILVRLSDPTPPAVSDYGSQLDVVLGVAMWSLGSARSAAGLDDTSASGAALYLGLRAGAGFGVDLL